MAEAYKRVVTTVHAEWYLKLPTDATEVAKVLSFIRQELGEESERTFIEVGSDAEEIVFSYELERTVRHA